jgi:hypothetical protein
MKGQCVEEDVDGFSGPSNPLQGGGGIGLGRVVVATVA